MAKTKEELNQLKTEYETLECKLQELSDDELKEVAGGSQRFDGSTYSSDTYHELGIRYYCNPGHADSQQPYHHPLIVSLFNWCKRCPDGCICCDFEEGSGLTMYCKARSLENDIYK